MDDAARQPSLDGAYARLDRAEELLADFHEAVDNFRLEHSKIAGSVDGLEEALGGLECPASLSIRVGEIAYNLRSALDYVVFELALLDSGAVQEDTQFPIADNEEGFRQSLRRGRLKGIHARHIDAITRLQPYSGCVWTRLLREISNPDKHRHLTALGNPQTQTARFAAVQEGDQQIPTMILTVRIDILLDDGTKIEDALEELKSEVADTVNSFKDQFPSA